MEDQTNKDDPFFYRKNESKKNKNLAVPPGSTAADGALDTKQTDRKRSPKPVIKVSHVRK